MLAYCVAWLAMIIAFLVIDGIWLGFVARDFYREQIGHLMRDQVWFGVAAMFYLIYTVAILILVVNPAYKAGSFTQAALFGALLGLCAYGTYDVTNLATLRGWPITVAIVDVVWGVVLTAMIASIGYVAMGWLRPA